MWVARDRLQPTSINPSKSSVRDLSGKFGSSETQADLFRCRTQLRDRDASYGSIFRKRVETMRITDLVAANAAVLSMYFPMEACQSNAGGIRELFRLSHRRVKRVEWEVRRGLVLRSW